MQYENEAKARKEAEMKRLAKAVEVMQDAMITVQSQIVTELPGEQFEKGGDNQTHITFLMRAVESYERVELKVYIRSSRWHGIYDEHASFEIHKSYGRRQTIRYQDAKKAIAKFKEFIDGLKAFDATKVAIRDEEQKRNDAHDALIRIRNREIEKIGLTVSDELTPCFTPNTNGTWLFQFKFNYYGYRNTVSESFPKEGKLLTTEQARQLVALLK